VYGLNYQIDIDPAAIEPGTLNVNYTGSWFGTKNTDMITMLRYNAGISDITQVRIDQNTISGMGKIAEITFIASNSISTLTSFPINVTAMAAIDNNGVDIPVTSVDSVIAVDPSLSVVSQESNFTVNVYPNPSAGNVHISSGNAIETVDIYAMGGIKVMTFEIKSASKTLDISNLGPGIYTLCIKGKQGVTTRKLTLLK